MRAVIQRVKHALVKVDSKIVGRINKGLLIFLGISKSDSQAQADYLVKKIIELRIFEDAQGKMNCSALEAKGEFLVVSQFTLLGDCSKGRRPSFDEAADPILAEELYRYFLEKLKSYNVKVEAGIFKAMMDVELINDGPVTFVLESN